MRIKPLHIIVFLSFFIVSNPAFAENKPQNESDVLRYTVEPGDNLGKIALRFGVGINQMVQWNRLAEPKVEPGTELIVKSKEKVKEEKKKPLPVIHRVKRGDTFEKISKKYKVSIQKIKRWNRRVNPRKMQIGQQIRLYIPGRDGKSVSWGKANGGRLYNGDAMESVPGMRVRNVARAYGTKRVVNLIEAAAFDLKVHFPDAADVEVGDISYRSGGKMRPHKSHQSGRDADISYFHKGNIETGFRDFDEETFDAVKNWHLFKTWIDSGQVEYIFVDYRLQKVLYEYAKSIGYTEAQLDPIFQYPAGRRVATGIIRHSKGHDDHFHIRFVCGELDKNCR